MPSAHISSVFRWKQTLKILLGYKATQYCTLHREIPHVCCQQFGTCESITKTEALRLQYLQQSHDIDYNKSHETFILKTLQQKNWTITSVMFGHLYCMLYHFIVHLTLSFHSFENIYPDLLRSLCRLHATSPLCQSHINRAAIP